MYKKKARPKPIEKAEVKPYVPKQDTKIYITIQRVRNKLTPVPYRYKTNCDYIKKILIDNGNI
jgi:hypothetical protein